MKKFKVLAALAVATLVSAPVFAADMAGIFKSPYLGADLNYQFVKNGEEANPMALTIKGGAFVHDYVALEARIGFGIVDDTVEEDDIDIDVSIDSTWGIYARGVYPIDNLQPYILLGFTSADLNVEADDFGVEASETNSSLSFGIGLDYKAADNFAATLEYAQFVNGDDFDLSALSIGAKYLF